MAWTQADIDALDAEIAVARSVQSATYSDQQVQFRPLDDLLKLRAAMAAAVAAAEGTGTTRYAATSKGV